MLNSSSGLLLLLLSSLEGKMLVLISVHCLPPDSGVVPSTAEGHSRRRPPACPRGPPLSWASICSESLPQNRLCSWTHGHSFAGLSGGNGCKGSTASSCLAAFGWHTKFPLMEPMIGSSLKSWLKKKEISTQRNRKQSLQNQKFSQIPRSKVEGRAAMSI